MALIANLRAKVRELTDADNTDLPRWQRALLYAVELGRFAAQKLRQDRAPQMAAALTYHTLFSLVPTLVLTLVVAQAFVSEQQLERLKSQTVDWAVRWLDSGIEQVREASDRSGAATPDNAATGEASTPSASSFFEFSTQARRAAEDAVEQNRQRLVDERRAEYAQTIEKLDDQLEDWLDQLQQVDFRSISIVGVLIFIYGATKLLSTIESSFNVVLRAQENRSWYVRMPLYYTTLTLAPVVLVAGQWAQQRFLDLIRSGGSGTAWFAGPIVVLSPLLTVWLVLLLAYRLLPNASLRLRPAAIGSFVAAVALGVAVEGFALYVDRTGSKSLYGALALLPIFLLLLWIVWQIVLYGLELASILQFMPDRQTRRKQQQADDGPKLVDPRLIIPALVLFARRFKDGQPLEPETLANELQLPAGATDPMLSALTKHGYIHRVAGDECRYTLARSPDTIELAALLETARQLGHTQGGAVRAPLQPIDRAEADAVAGKTLADLKQ